MLHDDGQLTDDLEEADVLLVGVSRTSKTPTPIYLANRGVKTANVPLVPGVPPPTVIEQLKRPLVVNACAAVLHNCVVNGQWTGCPVWHQCVNAISSIMCDYVLNDLRIASIFHADSVPVIVLYQIIDDGSSGPIQTDTPSIILNDVALDYGSVPSKQVNPVSGATGYRIGNNRWRRKQN